MQEKAKLYGSSCKTCYGKSLCEVYGSDREQRQQVIILASASSRSACIRGPGIAVAVSRVAYIRLCAPSENIAGDTHLA